MNKASDILNKDGEVITNRQESLLYVFPAASDVGPNLKVEGQIEALKSKYNTQLTTLNYPETHLKVCFLKKILRQVLSEFRFIIESYHFDIVYYRYNTFCPIYNLFIFFLSFYKNVWIEYNTVFCYHSEYNKLLKVLHWLQIRILAISQAKHLTVTKEIKNLEHLPKNRTFVMPNGFNPPKDNCKGLVNITDSNILQSIAKLKSKKNNKEIILCMIFTSDFAWHGIPIVEELLNKLKNTSLLLIGEIKSPKDRNRLESNAKIITTGYISAMYLHLFYKYVDFGLGPFNMSSRSLLEASPLKIREYLWNGIPAIINYHDPLLDEKWAKPFIFCINKNNHTELEFFLSQKFDCQLLRANAKKHLSWLKIFRDIGII